MRDFKITISKPIQVKNQAINIAKLNLLNQTYPTYSNHLALPGAAYTHLALPGHHILTQPCWGIISNKPEFEKKFRHCDPNIFGLMFKNIFLLTICILGKWHFGDKLSDMRTFLLVGPSCLKCKFVRDSLSDKQTFSLVGMSCLGTSFPSTFKNYFKIELFIKSCKMLYVMGYKQIKMSC